MASEPVYEAIRSTLVAAFPSTVVLRWEDVEDQTAEQGNLPFIAVEDEVATEQLASIGSPSGQCRREVGTINVHAFAPFVSSGTDTPLKTARHLGDDIRSALRGLSLPALPGWLRTVAAHPPAQEITNLGRWSAMTVLVDYQYDFTD